METKPNNKGVCHHIVALPFTLKRLCILRQKCGRIMETQILFHHAKKKKKKIFKKKKNPLKETKILPRFIITL
jgi:hypothetical protein